MTSETQRYLELLDRRTALLGTLAEALTGARGDIVSLDVDGLEARIAKQEVICQEVSALDAELDRIHEQCTLQMQSARAASAGGASEGAAEFATKSAAEQLREARDRLQLAQTRVKQLNNAHQILLRRCRRTAHALLNSYAMFAGTYADPFKTAASSSWPALVSQDGEL